MSEQVLEAAPGLATANIPAEQMTLAGMMLCRTPLAVEQVCEVVGPADFYRPQHPVIFMAVLSMVTAGEPCTPVTLLAWLQHDGVREAAYGGPMYLNDLFGLPVLPEQAVAHARLVWECAVRRKIAEAGVRLAQTAGIPTHSPAELIAEAQQVLTALARGALPQADGALTSAQFAALDTSRTSPVIPGLLDHEDRAVFVAVEGHGKSMLEMQIAYALGAGVHPFWPSKQIPPGRSLIIDLENPKGILKRRAAKYEMIASRYPGWQPGNVMIYSRPEGVNIERASDAFRLLEEIRQAQPDLLVIGPVSKMIREREHSEHQHAAVTRFCDAVRGRYGPAVIVEHHAPLSHGPGKRELRPRGSGIWSSWPEFGIALAPKGNGVLMLERFRGDREEGRTWPDSVRRATQGGWPFDATYPVGTFMDRLEGT